MREMHADAALARNDNVGQIRNRERAGSACENRARFGNLSKMVKSSSFISSSSGTVSMISSASRIASFTSAAVESQESALPLTPASNLPRATPSAKDRRIQAIASTSTCGEISSSTVLYPPTAVAYAIPRPIAPAPITAMVLTSILSCSPRPNERSFQQFLVPFFVKTQNHLRAAHYHRPANQIGLFGHQLNCFSA